jgi:biotin transport system substrate-specific component
VTSIALSFAPPQSRTGARIAFQIACAVAGSLLIATSAQVSIPLPFTPVPITGQTFGVLLIGAAFGPLLGSTTVLLYLAEAAIGLPFLAPDRSGAHATGLHVLTLSFASAGYLWGFVVAAWLVGWLSRRGWDRSLRSSVSAMFLGEVVLYAIGVPWLMASIHVGLDKGLAYGLSPFVVGDTVKLLVAAGVLPGAWKLLRRFHPEGA